MKNVLGFMVLAMLFVACSKDNRTSNKLEGTWAATSYKINSQEVYGDSGLVSKWEATFKPSSDASGDVTVDMTVFEQDTTYTVGYEVSNDGETLTIMSDDNDNTAGDLSLDSDKLTWSYNEDGVPNVLVAEKK